MNTSTTSESMTVKIWECKICSKRKKVFITSPNSPKTAIGCLKNHITSQEGNGHGKRSEYPETLNISNLPNWIEETD